MDTTQNGMEINDTIFGAKILHLTLNKQWFDLMIEGHKKQEFRDPSKWIESRLFNKDCSRKQYDYVKFTNGYGQKHAWFIAEFRGFTKTEFTVLKEYIGGVKLLVHPNTYCILLGKIVKFGNYEKKKI
jgi:hypothetical protein